MRNKTLISTLVAAIAGGGCGASHYLHGGILADHDYVDSKSSSYAASRCTNVATKEASKGSTATFHVVQEAGGPALFERNRDTARGAVITNHWAEQDGDHYFCWVGKNGYEYVVPAGGVGERRIYNDVKMSEANGVTKPTSLANFVCALEPIDGTK
jgi:hypothetical protein